MDTPSSYTKRFRQLRWKLALSYTGVTVGALLTVELIILASTAIIVTLLLNGGVIQTELINAMSAEYMPRCSFCFPRLRRTRTRSPTGWIEWVPRLVQPFRSLLMLPTNCLLLGMMVFYLGANLRTYLEAARSDVQ